MIDLQSTGVQLPKQMIEHLDEQADKHDTNRSAVIRAYLRFGITKADELPEDEVEAEILLLEQPTAPEMTQDGHHPRWDR